MRLSIEKLVTSPVSPNYLSETPYDSTKWNVGKGLIFNNGLTSVDKYIAPDFQAIRPMEESTPFAVVQIAAYNLAPDICYVFGLENSVAATTTRRIHLWTLNRKTGSRAWNGYITFTLATATAHTVRDFKIDVKNEAVGLVTVSGTTVTGNGTLFATNKVAVGARIGFGSTNPAEITTWYRVAARTSDTSITLNNSAPTISSDTPYIIQEFRPIYVATNATLTNGGIHYVKGVSIEDYTAFGTTIPLATTVDDQKASYWLRDAATQTNVVAAGCACNFADATPTSLDAYVIDLPVAGSYKIFKYNLRTALTVVGGASNSAFTLSTGNQAFTGTGSLNANCTFANANHGSGMGVKSIYFVSTTRVMRASISGITSGSVNWITDSVAEIPTGGSSTYPVVSTLSTIEYLDSPDVFVIGTTHAAGAYSYVSKFPASGTAFDKNFGRDLKYNEQSLKDSGHPTVFNNSSTVFSYTNAGGNRLFAVKQGIALTTNHIYVMSFGADWDYALQTSGRLISPAISTSNVQKYSRVFLNTVRHLGTTTLGKSSEAVRLYARTTNITTDSTSGWILIDETGDLSSFAGSNQIQFAVEFKTIGEVCLPTRILGLNIIYEDTTSDSHFAFSVTNSSASAKRFAWRFKTAFGGTVPELRVNIYNDVTNSLLLTDTTATSASGVFEKSVNGSTWTAYNSTDKTNETTYIRYTPTSIADNVTVAAYLVQN